MIATATPTCSPADHARLRPQRSCSKKISPLAIGLKRLGHDAHVSDSRTLHRIHNRCKCAERYVFVRAQEDRLMLRIAHLLPQFASYFIDVDGIVAEKYSLLFIDADHQALFRDLLNGPCLRDRNLYPGLKHWSGDHEDDQKDKHYVHERGYVDVGKSDLCAPVRCGERHYRRTSSATREAAGLRSTAFNISREKSSHRAAKSRMEPPIKL